MRPEKSKSDYRGEEPVSRTIYRSKACDGCPLAPNCVSPRSKSGRTITRDAYEEVRERTAARMATESAREVYNERPRIAETAFGYMKGVMGLRQFLLRGCQNVKTEWRWAVTAANLAKLVREMGRLRAEFAALAAAGET